MKDLEQLLRWEQAGAFWRVVVRSDQSLEVALLTCSADEEVGRLQIEDPAARAYIGDRDTNA